uniref:Uncharacterized protein n=1 Tax=viral metagenome TaxID=1070528 RepID=A0A6C0EQ52_9ZZZZ
MADEEAISGLVKLTKAPSAQEELAVDAMLNLKNIKDDPSKNEMQEIIRAAYALVDFSKIDIDVLKKQLSQIDDEIIDDNVDFLVESGILPPVDEMEGGAKRGRENDIVSPEPSRRSKRSQTPSRIIRDNISQEEEQKQDLLRKLEAVEKFGKKNLTDNYDDLPQILKDLDVCEHNSASIVMNLLFPKDVVKTWVDNKHTCRTIFELSEVETQCKNVVPPKVDDNCYICGFKFNEEVEGLQRTCEHILPIIQAVFFLELYTKGKTVNPVLLLEYDWAHRCCNYVKNDYSFLKTVMRNKYPTYEFNGNQTSVTLSLIQNLKEISPKTGKLKFEGLDNIQEQIVKHELDPNNKWKDQRLKYIKETKMDPIVAHIASKGDNGIALLIGFRNCYDTKNMHSKFIDLLSQSTEKQKSVGGKTFKSNNNVEFIHSSSRSSKKSSGRKTARINRRK